VIEKVSEINSFLVITLSFLVLAELPIHCALFSILSTADLQNLLLVNTLCMVIQFYDTFLFVLEI
jgi:hypothetical protein